MKLLKTILSQAKIDDRDKYLSREFQQYGIYLAEKLQDLPHKALYIKMAKQQKREVLEEALSFVLDANARSKAKLFMWKVAQLNKAIDSQPEK